MTTHRHSNLIIALIYLILLGIIIWYSFTIPPATEYEASFYFKYPPLFWASIIGIISFTTIIVLFSRQFRILHLVLIVTISIFTRILLNLIPYMRGYFLNSRSDALLHLGAIRDIIGTGLIPTQDFYPIPHVLVAIMSYVCNCQINLIMMTFPAYSFLIFIMGYYLFISKIFKTKEHVLAFFILALTVPIGARFVNRDLALSGLVIMLSIFASQRVNNASRYILLTILLANLVYFHPLTSIYTLGVIVICGLYNTIVNKNKHELNFLKYLGITAIILWTTWYLSFSQIQYNLRLLLTSEVNPYLSGSIHVIRMYRIPVRDLAKMIFYRYGEVILFGIPLLIISTKLLNNAKNIVKEQKYPEIKLLSFVLITLVFSSWGVATLVTRFVNYERIFKYIIMFSVPIVSYALLSNTKNNEKKILITLFIVLLMYLMTFSIYQSPLVGLENPQITKSEYVGWAWVFSKGTSLNEIYTGRASEVKWFYSAIYGTEKTLNNPLIYANHSLLPHFGYPYASEVGKLFTRQTYILTNKFMITFYPSMLPNKPDSWKWTKTDYARIKTDPSANSIYSSKDYWIYFVTPKKGDQNEVKKS